FTLEGMQRLLKIAFQGDASYAVWEVGLCYTNPADSFPDDAGLSTSVGEPDSTGGYTRFDLAQNSTDWPVVGDINGESYVESKEVLFGATGAFSTPVNRLFLTGKKGDGNPSSIRVIWAVSSAFPDGPQLIDS